MLVGVGGLAVMAGLTVFVGGWKSDIAPTVVNADPTSHTAATRTAPSVAPNVKAPPFNGEGWPGGGPFHGGGWPG